MLKHLTYGIPFALGMALLAYACLSPDPMYNHRFALALMLLFVACVMAVFSLKNDASYIVEYDEIHTNDPEPITKSYIMRRHAEARGLPVINIEGE